MITSNNAGLKKLLENFFFFREFLNANQSKTVYPV